MLHNLWFGIISYRHIDGTQSLTTVAAKTQVEVPEWSESSIQHVGFDEAFGLDDQGEEMTGLVTEVERFQKWADAYPTDQRSGEWECDYLFWDSLYEAVFDFVANHSFQEWSPAEVQMILYALARDNEMGHIAKELRIRFPGLLLSLTEASIALGERDNRWQLAEELGWLDSEQRAAERLLLTLAGDEYEYVRRRALGALTRLRSPAVESLALEAWNRPDPHQQWARMMALSCLHETGSPKLEALLAEAEKDRQQYLKGHAEKIRSSLASN